MKAVKRIYTRRGDDGTTGLRGGPRVPKDHPRVEAGGDLDELSAAIGAACAFARRKDVRAALLGVQLDLLDIGTRLADPKAEDPEGEGRVADLDRLVDRFEARLPPLRKFLVRGGTKGAALLHLACTVCRRAERRITTLSRHSPVPASILKAVNRLSSLLFVLARIENGEGR
jgi:cob(I)alamin adenosyltransferase